MPQDIGVEVPPRQLAAQLLVRLGPIEPVEDLAGVDAAVLEVGGQPGGGVGGRPVAPGVVGRRRAGQEGLQAIEGRRLAGRRQRGGGGGRLRHPVGAQALGPRHPAWCRQGRRPDPGLPRPVERGEHLERLTVALAHGARVDGVRRTDPHQPAPRCGQRPLHRLVPPRAVGAEVGGDVHRLGVRLGSHSEDHLGRVARPHDEVASDRGVQRLQAPGQKGQARRARRAAEPRVGHEQGDDGAASRRRLDQGRVVGQPEVPPEPEHGGRHHAILPTVPPGVPVSARDN